MIEIREIKYVYPASETKWGSTIFYVYGSNIFRIIPNIDYPIKKGDEVTYSCRRIKRREKKDFFLILSIHLTNNNYKKLPEIYKGNKKEMEFIGYMRSKNGIFLQIGFINHPITPKNKIFEQFLWLPLQYFGETDLPRYKGDIDSFVDELNAVAEKHIGKKICVKLRYRYNQVILTKNFLCKNFKNSEKEKG